MRLHRFVVAVALLPVTAAAQAPTERPKMRDLERGIPAGRIVDASRPNVVVFDFDKANFPQVVRDSMKSAPPITAKDVRDFISERTRLTFSQSHGSQIEYAGKDGKVYLWYPGNGIILSGQWKAEPFFIEFVEGGQVTKKIEQDKICFRYDRATFNPVTGRIGGNWECSALPSYKKTVTESEVGDTLNLKSQAEAPFILSRERTSLAAVRSRVGK